MTLIYLKIYLFGESVDMYLEEGYIEPRSVYTHKSIYLNSIEEVKKNISMMNMILVKKGE